MSWWTTRAANPTKIIKFSHFCVVVIGGKGCILQCLVFCFFYYGGFIGHKQQQKKGCEMCVVLMFALFLQWC